jgi:hypothetical protein
MVPSIAGRRAGATGLSLAAASSPANRGQVTMLADEAQLADEDSCALDARASWCAMSRGVPVARRFEMHRDPPNPWQDRAQAAACGATSDVVGFCTAMP